MSNQTTADIKVVYSCLDRINNVDYKEVTQSIEPNNVARMMPPTGGGPESQFYRLDVLNPSGDTLLHDAHLQYDYWVQEVERELLNRYHAHDIVKFTLVVK